MALLVRCPAKINTFLSVGPPDAKGWHPLRSIFQAIDLCDELLIEVASKDEVVSDAEWLPSENTLTKALAAARKVLFFPPLRVALRKRIPAQSGLGGGSSDAAGLLRAIRKLTEQNVDWISVAASIGADVPFFLVGGKASAEGYGEVLTPLPDDNERLMLVAKPSVGCSTPEMFKRLDQAPREWRDFAEDDALYNDFLAIAPAECRSLRDHLIAFGALDAGLTGSGSAVFGFFEDHTSALTGAELAKQLPGIETWPTRTLTREESLEMREI
ncbi:MAG TPA: 4-(cytidine 5'-diphospho)-2-C-methyl-D-erythritol kinase [Fimbriimonas sp.]|nr:4-(cytidine 5'-diphospho)-2-C-methyl-D-erythritol kinase [Fimbriimonas sp.]